jgi:hypothetical protein
VLRRRKFYGKLIVPVEIARKDVGILVYQKLLDPRHAKIGKRSARR